MKRLTKNLGIYINIETINLIKIDHIVGNVEDNKMDKWIKYYENIFDFQTFIEFTEDDIATKYSALRSKVVKSQNSNIKLPINEPAEGLKKSQIQEYLDSIPNHLNVIEKALAIEQRFFLSDGFRFVISRVIPLSLNIFILLI